MERMGCIDIPALPLQILLRSHPEWRELPAVVVDRDKPQGLVQWVNEHARACRILPGMRYATGLALSRDLRRGVVSDAEVADGLDQILHALWAFTPRIEPAPHEPGVFWLDASGLRRLYPSLDAWAASIRAELQQANFYSVVAVGFTRFGTYAAAKSGRHNRVFTTPDEESVYLRTVPIARLRIDPNLRDTLLKLGISTLDGFINLPPGGIRKRFGEEALHLHQLMTGNAWVPFAPEIIREPIRAERFLDYPETNLERLMHVVTPMLEELLDQLLAHHEELAAISIGLRFDDATDAHEELAPATPTRDAKQLLNLIHLRLDSLKFPAGIVEIALEARGTSTNENQLTLFSSAPRHNYDAIHRAFAKIRAELGNDAIAHARLEEGHLPEACYTWERLERPIEPNPATNGTPQLVRRIYATPVPLPPRARNEPDGWMVARMNDGPVEEVLGPHLVSGGWWRQEITRAYYYVRTRNGRWLWIYHDKKRRRWFLQGAVQ